MNITIKIRVIIIVNNYGFYTSIYIETCKIIVLKAFILF
jgi:hypothetical protein